MLCCAVLCCAVLCALCCNALILDMLSRHVSHSHKTVVLNLLIYSLCSLRHLDQLSYTTFIYGFRIQQAARGGHSNFHTVLEIAAKFTP